DDDVFFNHTLTVEAGVTFTDSVFNVSNGASVSIGGYNLVDNGCIGKQFSLLQHCVLVNGGGGTGGFPGSIPGTVDAFSYLYDVNSYISYQEGTFSPIVDSAGGFVTATYSTQEGNYRRENNWLFFNLRLTVATIAGG